MYRENKVINGDVVNRSVLYPNYGSTFCGIVYRWDTEKVMKITSVGRVYKDKQYLYPVFRACHNNKPKTVKVHVVVADCWVENQDEVIYKYVNHIDGNTHNNKASNLEWCTHAQNMQHRSNELNSKGENLYNASLTEDNVHLICKLLMEGSQVKDLAEMFSVTKDAINQLKLGSTYFHIRQLYDIPIDYKITFSEQTVRWVCERILEGTSDTRIVEQSTNKNLKVIEVKRIRHKIRYRYISDEYFS